MSLIRIILLVLAGLCFAIAAFGSVFGFTNTKYNLVAAGLLFWLIATKI